MTHELNDRITCGEMSTPLGNRLGTKQISMPQQWDCLVRLLYHVTGRLNSRKDQQLSFEVLALHASDPLSSFIVVIALATLLHGEMGECNQHLDPLPACGQGKLI